MVTKFIIRRNQYYDSVFLMSINKRLLAENGIIQSAVLMGTQGNKELLADIQVRSSEIDQASANDLVVAVIAETEKTAQDALGKLNQFLEKTDTRVRHTQLRTLEDGVRAKPDANLALISVPGEFAAREASKALENNLHVFLFSSNVSVKDELSLKKTGHQKGLLVMGPDCGTSIIGGKGIGFANRVRTGPIAALGPSGTGLQEFTCLVHHMGSGISHAIGTGSRDLKDEIGGLTTLMALDMLEKDAVTRVVAIVSKPAGKKTLAALLARLENYSKPVVACFLGVEEHPITKGKTLHFAATIDEAAEKAISLLGDGAVSKKRGVDQNLINKEVGSLAKQQKYLRGLFTGGTFCYQSQQILQEAGIALYSNEPLGDASLLSDPDKSIGNTLVDMGDEYYTRGKPHPMIDGTMRSLRITREAADPETAILLLDFILGFNSSNDPVGEAIEAILASKKNAKMQKRYLIVIASITGTEEDPQEMKTQSKLLEDAGVIVTHSNAVAARLCAAMLKAREKEE